MNLPGVAARIQARDLEVQAALGNCDAARSQARSGSRPDQSLLQMYLAGWALSVCGNAAEAMKVVDVISRRFPLDTLSNSVFLPSIRAAIEVRRDQAGKAIELLQSANAYERAYPQAINLRGLAYLRLRKGAEAAAEFHKILDHKGANWGVFYPASYVGLARAAALSGDTARSGKAYQDFLALWKDADPDVPLLIEARKEYAALH